jgi:hypothetical protein
MASEPPEAVAGTGAPAPAEAKEQFRLVQIVESMVVAVAKTGITAANLRMLGGPSAEIADGEKLLGWRPETSW